jgi:phage terminase large subunit-like protein
VRSASEGRFVIEFIERHCRITKGERAGQLVKLLKWQKELIRDLFALVDERRRYRRAYTRSPGRTARRS